MVLFSVFHPQFVIAIQFLLVMTHLHRDQPCNQHGWEELTGKRLEQGQRLRCRVNRCDVAVSKRG